MLYDGITPGNADLAAPGTSFEATIRAAANSGQLSAAAADAEAWLAERMANHREPSGPILQQRLDGTWTQIDEHKTRDGGTVALYTDITELKRAEEALRKSEERYTMAMEGANEGLWDWDAASDQIYISPRLKSLIGLTDRGSSITPAEWEAMVHREDLDLHRTAMRDHLKGKTSYFNVEYRVVGDDGVNRWVLNRGLASRGEDGRVSRMAGWLGDITDRKMAEFELTEAKDRAMDAARTKSQFLANMSHELRTPLNAILGYTELIADQIYGEVPKKIGEVIDRVQLNGQHLLGLINDVLDLSKIEAGQLELALDDYSMSDLIDTVMSVAGSLSAGKDLTLEAEIAADLPRGRADEQRIMQVLLNLVGNAVKFTERGEIAVRARVAGDCYLVSVADTGRGISETDQRSIFDEFRQADGSNTREQGGTGLGLAISKHMIEMHGGEISVESTLGVGSTFQFSLPIRVEKRRGMG